MKGPKGPKKRGGRISDLPLTPSKKNPRVRRHQRSGGETVVELGDGTSIERKVLDRLTEQTKREHRGKNDEGKIEALKESIRRYQNGDTSGTVMPGSGRGAADYVAPLREFMETLPKRFDDFVPENVKQEGDRLILASETTGYNVDAYGVGKAGEYSVELKEGNGKIIYHQYVQHPDHGEEVLKRLKSLKLETPYKMAAMATTVEWDRKWPEEAEIEYEQTGKTILGRSIQYAVVFAPEDKKQADKLVEFFERNARHGEDDAIAHSWEVPDIRSSFSEMVDEFEQNLLNTKRIGEHDLMVLKKTDTLDGFETSRVWLNRELSRFIKSLAIFVIAPFRGRPLVFGKSLRFSKIRRKGKYLTAVR